MGMLSTSARRRIAAGAWVWAVAISAACGSSDADVRAAVEAELAADPVTAPLDLSVDVRRGIVYLSGETSTVEQQERAAEVARSARGVSGVMSELTARDATLADAVRKALAADPMIGHIPITVDARDGLVQLVSDATNREERERAVAVARGVDGVTEVEDRMK